MATLTWDAAYEATPAGSDAVSGGDDRIRELKVAVRERMLVGGHLWQETTNTHDGKHTVNADGSGAWNVYKTDKTTVALEVTDTTIKADSTLEWQNSSGDPLTRRRRMIAWTYIGEVITGSADWPMIELRAVGATEGATLVEVGAIVKTAPTGATLDVDLHWSPAADTNPNTNLASVFTSTVCQIAAAAFKGTATSGFSKTSFAADDVLMPVVDQVGSTIAGEDLTVYAVFEWPS